MSTLIDMRVLDLLSARLCHELISPVGAIANGVELLGEDDPDFVQEATSLIAQSARKAGQRLQFYRFAYGASSGGGSGPDPRQLVDGLLEGGKTVCEWRPEALGLPAAWRKLACNLVVFAGETLPRGGTMTVAATTGTAPSLDVTAQGETINLTGDGREALAMRTPVAELTSRTIHGYYTACLARQLAASVAVDETPPGRLVLRAASAQ
jgi:histidine phosphotransferase ChpT